MTPLTDDGSAVGPPDVEGRSVGDLLGEVTANLSKLMRQEVALAKVELKEEAAKAGKAGGLLGGAGAVGYLVLVFLSLALMFALDNAMGIGWAALWNALKRTAAGASPEEKRALFAGTARRVYRLSD